MNEHDNWRTWDKHRDCRGPTKVWMDGCAKDKYEDLSMDAPPDDDEPEGLEDDSSAAWEHETRQVKRKLEMQPSSSSGLARPRGEAVL